ncbi:cytochrome P450 [Streptomyces sp. SL13]|uniref:Cytochrome P450 n=1 Tax=Streptantibioticus silvisoli TaxID=2705255 RepID=A0AA90GYS0_9ACTN|nr:cytochrome P450 [Streptantibioticus silvisoli]MDI5965478.1 cytochrome P450 [Streptantibioticus silvisoli]MDI5968916.1 cytochrome P450 [Streptantibioticus silvisoli]
MTEYFDFTSPLLETHRVEYYGNFQKNDPIHWTPYGYWVLFRYDDAHTLLRTPGVSSNFPANPNWAAARGGPSSPAVKSAHQWMLMQDGAAHRRLRGSVGKLFSPRMLELMRTRIPQIVSGLLDEIGDAGEIDLMSSIALPLPTTVVSELLGVPEQDREMFRSVTEPIGQLIDRVVSPERLIAMNKAEPKARAYVYRLIEKARQGEPDNTLASVMVRADDDFTDDEIAANTALLYNAGYETTSNLIGNGMLALLQQPDAMRALRDDPSLIPTGVEELSRFYPSARFVARILTEDLKIRETVIPAGECVFVAFDAVGRDPERYPDPHRLDMARTGVKSLAFSAGPHHCMGKALGLLEVSSLLTELFRRYRSIELAGPPKYHGHFNLRALTELPLRLRK